MIARIFHKWPTLWWLVLLLISAVLGGLLIALHIPAGVLVGCIVAGVVLALRDVELGVPRRLFMLAQGLIGCLIAKNLLLSTLVRLTHDWPIFLVATVSLVAASAGLGWVLMRRQVMPGTTAVWGLAPGGASAMVVMSEAYGADVRLVAFMQYSRMLLVTVVASLVTWWWSPRIESSAAAMDWFVVHHFGNFGWTLLLGVAGPMLARWLAIPAGTMLVPMLLGAALQATGLLVIELPPAVLAVAYAVIGWSIGLRFTRTILRHAWRAMPQVFGAIVVLMAFGIAMAVVLTLWSGFDPFTAYLATSPGGADSVAIIAATSAVDAGFVMAMQMARLLMVIVVGPRISQFVSSRKTEPQTRNGWGDG